MNSETQNTDFTQILVVDDTPANLKLLTEILTNHGYRVRPASNGRLALKSVAAMAPDLILLDVTMPDMDGYEVCSELKSHENSRSIPVIFISALNDTADKLRGFEAGGIDYITKPFQAAEVLARVETHLSLRRLQKKIEVQNIQLHQEIAERIRFEEELKKYQEHLEELVAARTTELNVALGKLTEMSGEIIERLTAAAELRDEDTGMHIIRIGMYARILSIHMGMPEEFVRQITVAAAMHDVGKIGIPDSILLKPAPLTAGEFETIKQHTLIGEKILLGSPHALLQMGASIAVTHHERWDGSGYPYGLSRNDIPMAGRIVMIADHYDALRNSRVYKPAFSHERACDIIENGDGRTMPGHFDPAVLSAFNDIKDEFACIFESGSACPAGPFTSILNQGIEALNVNNSSI